VTCFGTIIVSKDVGLLDELPSPEDKLLIYKERTIKYKVSVKSSKYYTNVPFNKFVMYSVM